MIPGIYKKDEEVIKPLSLRTPIVRQNPLNCTIKQLKSQWKKIEKRAERSKNGERFY